MSNWGGYIKTGVGLFNSLEEGKPHSSVTDWIEVLSSDRYEELSLDGIPELVESINLQGAQGTTEGARAIRKKLKYGNVHRQLRALVILRALTENAGRGFQVNWANPEILNRLKEMANDSLLDPKVKKRLILVFHAWSVQYKDEPRMQHVAGLYRQFGGGGPAVRKPTAVPLSSTTTSAPRSTTSPRASTEASRPAATFSDYDAIFGHDWKPAPGARGPDTYADLAAAKQDADERKRQREARILLEQREAEIERREREHKRKTEMAAIEARRQKEAAEEAERRRKAKEDLKNRPRQAAQPQRPKFDFQKEKPQIMVAVATAIQAANNLVNSCRHLNREYENVTESPKVQDNLDKAKVARRPIIRYIQLVNDESFVGTLLDANEKVVEAIQLYDKLSKPAVLDSDSDSDDNTPKDVAVINKKLAAQKLEADRTGELQRLQERQKRESAKQQQRRAAQRPARQGSGGATHPDLQDLDFGSISSSNRGLPAPLHPDSDRESYESGSLSDYDSSDEEWRASQSKARAPAPAPAASSKRAPAAYRSLDDDNAPGRKGLLDPNDPFGDEMDELETPVQERQRMQWTEI